jgi:hypothetical protein
MRHTEEADWILKPPREEANPVKEGGEKGVEVIQ